MGRNRTWPDCTSFLDGGIADRTDAKDRVGLSIEKGIVHGGIVCTDELKICLVKAEVFGQSQERLKLASSLCESDPLAT